MRDSVVTVFGGSGFIGRYVVQLLAGLGATVRVPTRRPERALFLKPMGAVGQIVLEPWDPRGGDVEFARHLAGCTHAANLIGILAEGSAGGFDQVQGRLPGRIAAAAATAGASSLVHVSAIGADAGSPSAYARTKAAGEEGARAAFGRAAILRPSVVFGPEDQFFNRFARMAQVSPFLPLIGGGRTRFQPVYVADVAAAAVAALRDEEGAAAGRTFELGGPSVYTFRELMAYLLKVLRRRRALVSIPFGLARQQARLLQLLPEPPLTVDQVELLARDNVVAPGAPGLAELGVAATPLEAVVPAYVQPYARQPARLPAA